MSAIVSADGRLSTRGLEESSRGSHSLEPFFRSLDAHWHSDWAWEHYGDTILALARQFGLKRFCEIGGGRGPLFQPGEAARLGVELTINDIDAGELALAPQGLRTARFDIAGDMSEPDATPGRYDLMFSRMVFEHVHDVPRAWANIHTLLAPGGVALAFFPTLWAPVFALNHILPETASRAILHAVFPARKDDGNCPKFPAFYDHCRGDARIMTPMLNKAGFADVHVQPFWGHGYFERMPGLKQIDHAANALAARVNWPLVTTYAFVMVRKAPA
jgi:SAM-dependent methyltransferase